MACNTTTLKSSTFTPSCADVDETCYASAVGTSIGCPLDYPLFQPVRKLYKDTHAVVSPVVESTLGQINTEFVGPALEKLDTHVLQPHVFPLWKQHGAPVYTSVHTHPTVRQVLDEQVPIYWQSVKDTWHSAAEFVVNDAAPVAMSYSKQAVEFVDQHVKPHVYTGVDVAGQYVAVARDTASKTLNDIHTSEQVQAIYKSEAGQSAFKLYGDYIVKPWTVYVQPQVEEGVALWTSGVATLVNTVDCFLFSEEGDAKCSAAVRLASLQKYILDIFK